MNNKLKDEIETIIQECPTLKQWSIDNPNCYDDEVYNMVELMKKTMKQLIKESYFGQDFAVSVLERKIDEL